MFMPPEADATDLRVGLSYAFCAYLNESSRIDGFRFVVRPVASLTHTARGEEVAVKGERLLNVEDVEYAVRGVAVLGVVSRHGSRKAGKPLLKVLPEGSEWKAGSVIAYGKGGGDTVEWPVGVKDSEDCYFLVSFRLLSDVPLARIQLELSSGQQLDVDLRGGKQ